MYSSTPRNFSAVHESRVVPAVLEARAVMAELQCLEVEVGKVVDEPLGCDNFEGDEEGLLCWS